MKIIEKWSGLDVKRAIPFLMRGERSSPAASLVEIDGKRLLLRNGTTGLWFRYIESNQPEWTYFVYESADQNAHTFDKTWLEKQYRAKQYGRIVPVSIAPDPECREFEELYFRTDGTGFVWPHLYTKTDFSWEAYWEWQIDPLHESFEVLSHIGRLVFDAVNAKQADPRIDPASLEDQPLEFINGSQEELEKVTRWICHSGAGRPDRTRSRKSEWDVTYSAPCVGRDYAGGILRWSFSHSPKLQDLFNLAYNYNSFVGYHWEYNDETVGYKNSYDPEPYWISFTFPLASPDEQSTARAELRRWLDGKATPEEIQHFLGTAEIP